jgi:DNA-binding response OmpR family regulator
MPKIMIIEDDKTVRDELALLLKNEGYQPIAVTVFENILTQVSESNPDLILLDLGLPGRDGFSLCADFRRNFDIPIIFVTSRDSAYDELNALSTGGDDYITKPYHVPVLLARIRAVLRRSSKKTEPELPSVNGLTLNPTRGTASANGKNIELTRNELQILTCLMEHAGEVVSRTDLIESLWDNRIYIDDNTLSVNMTRLRAKLGGIGLPDFIKTRRGMGYQIIACYSRQGGIL